MVAGELGAKLVLLLLNSRSDGVGDGDGGGGELLLIVVAIVVCFSALSLLSDEDLHTKNHNHSFFVNLMMNCTAKLTASNVNSVAASALLFRSLNSFSPSSQYQITVYSL